MNNSQRQLNALRNSSARFVQWNDSILDYKINWAGVFPDDPISASAWTVETGTATLTNSTLTGNIAKTRLEAGVGTVVLVNRVETDGEQFDSRAIIINVRNKSVALLIEGELVTFGGESAAIDGDYCTW
jgi:hypothetical protein